MNGLWNCRSRFGVGMGWVAVSLAILVWLVSSASALHQPTFKYSRTTEPISIFDIIDTVNRVAPSAFVHGGRETYLPVNEDQLAAFLRKTKIERSRWQMPQDFDGSVEKQCTSYSLLFFALVEQERLRSKCQFPLAFCRVSLFNHSLNGFFNEKKELKLLDPQLDRIFTLEEWAQYSPEDHDISVVILE